MIVAQIHKIEFYFVDVKGYNYDLETWKNIMTEDTGLCLISRFGDSETVDVEWDDNLQINYTDCEIQEFRNYFE